LKCLDELREKGQISDREITALSKLWKDGLPEKRGVVVMLRDFTQGELEMGLSNRNGPKSRGKVRKPRVRR